MTISIQDIARYFFVADVNSRGLSSSQLHKLCFVADAMYQRDIHMPLFSEYFQHTPNGPQYSELLPYHKGETTLYAWPAGNVSNLSEEIQGYLNWVFNKYTVLTGPMLSMMTKEFPEYTETDQSVLIP